MLDYPTPSALVFVYPTPSALAGYLREELTAVREESPAVREESPVVRGESPTVREETGPEQGSEEEAGGAELDPEAIDQMDLDDLMRVARGTFPS